MTRDRHPHTRLLIGDLLVDTGRRQVRRHGKPIDIPKLSYRLLLVLAEAAPNVVTQDELIERVWPGRIVSPETVTQRVKLLRNALGDDAASPRYVGLVRGEGYRLLVDVDELPPEDSGPRRGRLVLGLALVLLVAATGGLFYLNYPSVATGPPSALELRRGGAEAPPNTIAVLPFSLASEDRNDLYISDGLGDALRERLGRLGGLQVAARSSSTVFAEEAADAIEIADSLGVSKLVEGTVQRQGQQLSISVHIIDGESGFQTWSNTYVRSMDDLLEIQQEVAEQVVRQLLPERDESLDIGNPASLDPTATELIWLADHSYREVRAEATVDLAKLTRAIDLYRRATEADANSAIAYSRLGAALLYLGDVEAAARPIAQAMLIDPELSEVHYTQGLYYWSRYQPGSGEAYRRAIELNPNNADALDAYAKWIWHQLIWDEPEEYFLRALELDPMSIARFADLGTYYGMSGMREKARGVVDSMVERFSDANACMVAARTLELAGDIDEAIGWAMRARELEPDNPEPIWQIAELYARIGDFETARSYERNDEAFNLLYWEREYEDMIDVGEELVFDYPNQIQLWYGLARAYNATGSYEQAVHVLEENGLPDRAFSENRRANDEEALIGLADAYRELGDLETAASYVRFMMPKFRLAIDTGGQNSWWAHLYNACSHSILDEDSQALDELELMARGNGMPWYPVLVDAPCFRKFADEPRYRAVLRSIEAKKQALRERLPATLERFAADDSWRR